ncbi:protein yippee isoform X1 [Vigna umbellata]|uniref:protein yippee isoform X1 n=1 Tax=Vigna umbellata TaxID=87088 RepID=UPI001F5E3DE4|nr:protein yippee isoform X1 [Vigna umbellata]
MGRLFVVNLEGKIYSCKHCHTHLALYDDIYSKTFHCRHGKAYLFNKVKLPMKKTRSTRKENPCLNGTKCQVRMEAIIGSVMRHMLVEVMQMMLSHPTIHNCTFLNPVLFNEFRFMGEISQKQHIVKFCCQ